MSNRLGQFEKLTRASAPVLVQSQFFCFVLFSGLIVDPGRHWNPFILDSEHSKKNRGNTYRDETTVEKLSGIFSSKVR